MWVRRFLFSLLSGCGDLALFARSAAPVLGMKEEEILSSMREEAQRYIRRMYRLTGTESSNNLSFDRFLRDDGVALEVIEHVIKHFGKNETIREKLFDLIRNT
jgi:hypothetical protein